MADCLLQQDDVKLIEVKEYIKNPKPNGYRSLHLIIEIPIFLKDEKKDMRVEVQLRTIAMDFWASLDHKLSYKKDIEENKVDPLSRTLEKRVIKKLLKADFCIVQESAFLNSTENSHYYNPCNDLSIF